MIAAVHSAPAITVPMALLFTAVLVWYWVRLNDPDVPAPRRHRRRVTIVMLLAALGLLVAGLSFIDPARHQVAYMTVWSLTLLLMLIIFIAACADAALTIRADRYEREIQDAARRARTAAVDDDQDRDDELCSRSRKGSGS